MFVSPPVFFARALPFPTVFRCSDALCPLAARYSRTAFTSAQVVNSCLSTRAAPSF